MIVGENEMTGPPFVQRHIWLLNVQVYLKWKAKIGYQNRTRRSVLGRKMGILAPLLSSEDVSSISLAVDMGNWVLRFGWWHGAL